jgi:hypothetical protein
MKIDQKIILFGLLIFLLDACSKSEINLEGTEDYVIFGHFFGECQGESCVETYLIKDEKLFEDETDPYAGGTIDHHWKWNQLTDEKYELAKDIFDIIPSTLLESENQTFGMPDAGDWGGILLEVKRDGEVGRWLLDLNETTTPEPYYEVSREIFEIIEKINK